MRNKGFIRLSFALLLLYALAGPLIGYAQTSASSLPAGIKLVDEQRLNRGLPPNYAAAGVEADWTHPLLQVSALASGNLLQPDGTARREKPSSSTTPAIAWIRAINKQPDSLLIQLIEPHDAETTCSLPVTLNTPGAKSLNRASVELSDFESVPHVQIGGLAPWVVAGPSVLAGPAPVSPLLNQSAHAWMGARWGGRLSSIDQLGNLVFRQRILFSLTAPDGASTRFILLWRTDDARGSMDNCRAWLARQGPPQTWLVIHAAGPEAIVGMGEWRLGPASDPRRMERLGAAMSLRPSRAANESGAIADSVDWARLRGATWEASSYERAFGPWRLGSGNLIGDPFGPALWMSRPKAKGSAESQVEWCMLKFSPPRPVEHVAIYWASCAGWDAQFNPAQAALEIEVANATEPRAIAVECGTAPVSVLAIGTRGPEMVRSIRIMLANPERQINPVPRARVMALQAWGPWDGQTIANPMWH